MCYFLKVTLFSYTIIFEDSTVFIDQLPDFGFSVVTLDRAELRVRNSGSTTLDRAKMRVRAFILPIVRVRTFIIHYR